MWLQKLDNYTIISLFEEISQLIALILICYSHPSAAAGLGELLSLLNLTCNV